MKRFLVMALSVMLSSATITAQRQTDKLDRGLIAVQARQGGLLLSWRVQANEYYDVTYNIYRNGAKLNAQPLTVSNYYDAQGSASANYTVRAVVNGKEQADSKPAKKATVGMSSSSFGQPGYINIRMYDVIDRNGDVAWSPSQNPKCWDYSINDVSLADLDGDGEVELIVKRINESDASTVWPNGQSKELYGNWNQPAYSIIEAYKLNGQRLWWIDCGPNMVSGNCTELNAVAYDWDEDGKAEVIMRGADNMIIHMANGKTYNVGNMKYSSRNSLTRTNANMCWTHEGAEYLLYLNGATAQPYSVTTYPIARGAASDWGDGYGHRSSKYFFGAPVLDGRHASIFLARGIYTQTKMVALDVNRSTHQLTERWRWEATQPGKPWYGQGNHNFTVADVDGDGKDEIVYGSMCIDDNGAGMSTTGLGHGDAMHVGDLDPFTKGLEVFACNEDNPGNNLRNATTSEIYHRGVASGDDGRALMGNFHSNYPGCTGRSTIAGTISATSHRVIPGVDDMDVNQLNARIYWDGDLNEELLCSTNGAINQPVVVLKQGKGRIFQSVGAITNNGTKKNACAQGDILGDWREEIIARSADDQEIRIYSTDVPTNFRIPCLWYDHQYRQAMVWQCCAYNQPPHVSYFMGELEGLTKVPLPLTNEGRTQLTDGGTINSSMNGKDLFFYHNYTGSSSNIGIEDAAPHMVVIDVPSYVAGKHGAAISYSYATCNLGISGRMGDLSGAMHLAKQGDGLLNLGKRTFTYSGNTDVFAGHLYFGGTMQNSNIWLNRHTMFFCNGDIQKELTMEYASTLAPSNAGYLANPGKTSPYWVADYASMNVATLNMNEGSRLIIQISKGKSDQINIGTLNLRKQNWKEGPRYLAPVFEIQSDYALPDGAYKIGSLGKVGKGALTDFILECNNKQNASSPIKLQAYNGILYFVVGNNIDLSNLGATWVESYRLDFEQAGTNYGFTKHADNVAAATFSQVDWGNGKHGFHMAHNGNGERTGFIDLASKNADFSTATEYTFDFDFGFAQSDREGTWSSFFVYTPEGKAIFRITTDGGTTAKTTYLYDEINGQTIPASAAIPNDGLSKACPRKLSHYTITGNSTGTYLTVKNGNTVLVNNYRISNSLIRVGQLCMWMQRYNSHAALDDIVLMVKKNLNKSEEIETTDYSFETDFDMLSTAKTEPVFDQTEKFINISPLGNKARINISSNLIGETKAIVYNLQGSAVNTVKLQDNVTIIDLPSNRGLYIIRVEGPGIKEQAKILTR